MAPAAGAAAAPADPGAARPRRARPPAFPSPWSVRRWIDGRPAAPDRIADLTVFADDLARFLLALWGADAARGPAAGPTPSTGVVRSRCYDGETRTALATLGRAIDAAATGLDVAGCARRYPDGPAGVVPRRRRGGQPAGRRDGRLTAMIDFGTCGVGDPACDLVIAWTLLARRPAVPRSSSAPPRTPPPGPGPGLGAVEGADHAGGTRRPARRPPRRGPHPRSAARRPGTPFPAVSPTANSGVSARDSGGGSPRASAGRPPAPGRRSGRTLRRVVCRRRGSRGRSRRSARRPRRRQAPAG